MTSLKRLSILAAATLLAIGAVSVVMAQTTGTDRQASPSSPSLGQAVGVVVPSAVRTSG